MGLIKNLNERRVANRLDKQALEASLTDPDVTLAQAPDQNADHGANTRSELNKTGRHVEALGSDKEYKAKHLAPIKMRVED
jgi:hypothetical protein